MRRLGIGIMTAAVSLLTTVAIYEFQERAVAFCCGLGTALILFLLAWYLEELSDQKRGRRRRHVPAKKDTRTAEDRE